MKGKRPDSGEGREGGGASSIFTAVKRRSVITNSRLVYQTRGIILTVGPVGTVTP